MIVTRILTHPVELRRDIWLFVERIRIPQILQEPPVDAQPGDGYHAFMEKLESVLALTRGIHALEHDIDLKQAELLRLKSELGDLITGPASPVPAATKAQVKPSPKPLKQGKGQENLSAKLIRLLDGEPSRAWTASELAKIVSGNVKSIQTQLYKSATAGNVLKAAKGYQSIKSR